MTCLQIKYVGEWLPVSGASAVAFNSTHMLLAVGLLKYLRHAAPLL
jgi:hypothetical protein